MADRMRTTVRALGELFDGPHATPERREKGPYFLNISSLKSGRLDLAESDHVSAEDFAKWTRRVTPREKDLLFSYETRLGEAALMPEGVQACLGRRMALLRPDASVVDPRFLLYLYLSPSFQRTIQKHMVHGATVPRIGLATMPDWEVEIPQLPEQQAIAEVLGALDDKIAASDRLVALADELGRARFVADLDLAGEFQTITLGDLVVAGVLELGDGYRTKRSEHGQNGYRIVRAGDVSGGRVDVVGTDFVAAGYAKQIGRKTLQPGDVVLTTKGTVGRVAVVPNGIAPSIYSPQLCYFRVMDDERLDAAFLAGWLRSNDLQVQIAARMFKSDMAPYVNLQDVRSLEIPLPSIEVQRHIGKWQGALQQLAHANHRESSQLATTRDELLPLLMSGRVRVKDAEKIVEGAL